MASQPLREDRKMKRQKTLKDLIANQLILDHGEHSIRPLYIYIKCPIGTDIMSVRLFSYVISLCKILFAMFLIIICIICHFVQRQPVLCIWNTASVTRRKRFTMSHQAAPSSGLHPELYLSQTILKWMPLSTLISSKLCPCIRLSMN